MAEGERNKTRVGKCVNNKNLLTLEVTKSAITKNLGHKGFVPVLPVRSMHNVHIPAGKFQQISPPPCCLSPFGMLT